MDPELEMDTDDVAGVGFGVGLMTNRVVLTVVELTGAGVDGAGAEEEGTGEEGDGIGVWVEGPEVTVLYLCSVEVTGTEEVVSPMVIVVEAVRWVVWVGPLEVGQLTGLQHWTLIW